MGRRILTIAGELFAELFSGEKHYRVVADAIPADARIVNVRLVWRAENTPQDISILLESVEWGEAPENQPYPPVTPAFQALYPREGEYRTFAEPLRETT